MPIISTFFFLLSMLLIFSSCSKNDKNYPPSVYYESISKYVMRHNAKDSFVLELTYSDKNGDIGHNTNPSLFLYDIRNNDLLAEYILPNLNTSEAAYEQEGSINFVIPSPCCHNSAISVCALNDIEIYDSTRIKIVIKDRAGLESKAAYTDKIRLHCIQ